jgi:DNA-binding NtrC family response regulator
MEKQTILFVDDEESIRSSVSRKLVKKGYDVETAVSGEDAIIKLHQTHYSLVITDLMMGKKNGVDVFNEVYRKNVNTNVMIITGFASSPLLETALALGPCGYLLKPFKSAELYQMIQKCLDKTS